MWECPRCGHEHVDEVDVKAQQSRCLTYAEAARRCGHSVTWVKSRIMTGLIRMTEFAGRRYVSGDSVDELLGSIGFPSPIERALEEAEERGDRFAVMQIQADMAREADDRERAMFGGQTIAEIVRDGRAPREIPPEEKLSPAQELIAKFGRGRP